MDLTSSVVASASVVALLLVVGWTAMRAPMEDQRHVWRVLLGAAALVVAVGVIAFVWTLTRP